MLKVEKLFFIKIKVFIVIYSIYGRSNLTFFFNGSYEERLKKKKKK